MERRAWDRWDRPGRASFNVAGPAQALAAAQLVRTGAVLRLDLPPDFFSPPLFARAAHVHHVQGDEGDFARDDLLDGWNTQASTHWDGLRHVREGAGFFGGRSGAELGAEHLADPGLVTRAVLADVVRWRESTGRPLDPCSSEAITVADLEATLAHQGTVLQHGDVLLIRTGWAGWYAQAGPAERQAAAERSELRTPGLLASQATADWLAGHNLAGVAADNSSVEAWPLRSGTDGAGETLHVLAMVRLGIVLGELWRLDELADHCASDRRWVSMLVSAPLAFRGACATPANALVIR
ncbi:MAG: cyclase family protein [Microthrixaceae bacterium]